MRTLWSAVGMGLLALGAVACGGSSDEEDGDDFGAINDEAALRGRSITVPSGGSKSFSFSTQSAGPIAIIIDCGIPSNPDSVGGVFTVESSGLSLPSDKNAAYFAWAGEAESGSHTVTLKSAGAGATCEVKLGRLGGSDSCKTFSERRSPNTNHTHFEVGSDTSDDWESFPASGNHWGAWAPWNKAYSAPVKRGFALHNMEHGGSVLSYKCNSPDQSSDCQEAENKLKELVNSTGLTRYIITPDPDQPEMFAVRTWRMTHSSSCLNGSFAGGFLESNMRNGREDIDADPPIPFDPTTTNVPCQDLMAAPDSCN